MSQPYTEGAPQPPVSPAQAQQETAAQLGSVAADLGPGPQQSPADLGAQMAASGAHPGEVDVNELLSLIRGMQGQIDQLQAAKRADDAPAVLTYAQALADHVTAKAAANPVLAVHPDHPLQAGVKLAGNVVTAAQAVVDGQTGALEGPLSELTAWVAKVAKRTPHLDWGYVLELGEEAAGAVARLI